MKKLALVLAVFACGPPEDFTPLVHVDPNAAKRIELVHRPDKLPANAARVHAMKAGEELGGPNATGKPGDYLLENDEVTFVIEALGHSAGFGVSGGNVIDAADAKSRKDELGQVLTYFGAFPRQGVYESIDTGVTNDGIAWVDVRGHELNEAKVAVRTRYVLHPTDRALLIDTSLENKGDQPVIFLGLGDAIQWGGTEKFAPDRGRGFKGSSSGSFLAGVGRYASYAITSTDGAIDAESGPGWSDTLQARRTEIPAGKSVHYTRVFLVGPRADVSGLVAELTKTAGGVTGALRVELNDSGKVAATPDATIEIAVAGSAAGGTAQSATGGKAIMEMRPDAAGALAGELPPGKYVLRYAGGGGRGGRASKSVEIAAGKEETVTLDVTPPARLHAQCKERPDPKQNASAVPCKATFEGLGVANPDFGPGHAAGPAKNQVTTKDGEVDVPLAPGKYRVTLSRGPEYALSQFEVDVRPGTPVEACDVGERCLLKRVVDTKGWLACDFHQHTMLGVDAPTSTRDRVIGNVAEGVEIAVATEHNIIADLEPIVRDLGLESRLVEISGDELTTDTSHRPWGHANVFPLGGTAINVRDREVKDLFAELRTQNPGAVFMINHPRSGGNGYFDLLDFDRATGSSADARWESKFDAVELWNGRNVAQRGAVLEDVMSLLRNAHPTTITGTTDTHGMVGQEAGYPRTYVKAKDDALGAWDASRTGELVKSIRETREVVVTNGPFIRVKRAQIGSVNAARGSITLDVTVTSAPWIEVKKLKLVHVSKNEPIEKDVTMHAVPSGAMEASASFTFKVDKDDAVFVIASGDKPLSPVLPGDAAEIRPWAITGAIWLDADGDGHSLGR
ncbi:MAG TPA: CehA/McbA family metallohydrolase [Polyangiaceae bacterium]|nr:CehA/McbA family metallohydrolase [Polyangiaceae bacterium]